MDEHAKARITAQSDAATISTELASRRTGMSFQRTRMSADRTLMSVIRTSLSLIGFGFTISQVFQKLYEAEVLKSSRAPRRFGEALVALGIAMLLGRRMIEFNDQIMTQMEMRVRPEAWTLTAAAVEQGWVLLLLRPAAIGFCAAGYWISQRWSWFPWRLPPGCSTSWCCWSASSRTRACRCG